MLTWTQVLAVGLLLSLCLHAWQLKLLADERQRSNCWRSKFLGANYYLTGQDFPTVSVPVDLSGFTISERDVQP